MEVLLLKNVPNVGRAGEIARVSDGYARNYLFPRGLAELATEGAVHRAGHIRQEEERQRIREARDLEALAQLIEGQSLTFHARAGERDQLYGSITAVHIAEALSEQIGREIDKRKIDLPDPLRALGTREIEVHLSAEFKPVISVTIEREED